MTEREKWEAGLWYDANFDPEICAEREKAEELYTEFNQTRPSEKARRAELLHKLLPGMAEDVVILPGVTIGEGTVIGAGSVVAKDIPAGVVAVGSPCRVLRPITEKDSIRYKR